MCCWLNKFGVFGCIEKKYCFSILYLFPVKGAAVYRYVIWLRE